MLFGTVTWIVVSSSKIILFPQTGSVALLVLQPFKPSIDACFVHFLGSILLVLALKDGPSPHPCNRTVPLANSDWMPTVPYCRCRLIFVWSVAGQTALRINPRFWLIHLRFDLGFLDGLAETDYPVQVSSESWRRENQGNNAD